MVVDSLRCLTIYVLRLIRLLVSTSETESDRARLYSVRGRGRTGEV